MPMANADPRSRAMFGAAYFVGYCASLGLEEGTVVNAVALGDTMGDRGLVSDDGATVRQRCASAVGVQLAGASPWLD